MAGADKGGLSIGARLTLATVGVLTLASVLLYVELTARERQGLIAAKTTAAAMVTDLFAASLSAPLVFSDNDAVEAELANLKANPELACAAVFTGGDAKGGDVTPVAATSRSCDAATPILPADLAAPTLRDDRIEVCRVVLGRRGEPVGRARVVFSLARENAAFAVSRARIFWLSALLAAGTAAFLLAIARRQIVLPLARLVDAVGRVGRGDLGAKVDVWSKDEIGQLARAFNRMSEALADRDERLAAATQRLRDLLDHMRQGIFAFDKNGKIESGASRQARALFGQEVEEARVTELLYRNAPAHDIEAQAFTEWAEMAFTVPAAEWGEFALLAPREVSVRGPDGTELPLEIEFRPIAKGDDVERVMLLATDVSEQRRLEEAVEAQEEEHARKMAAMRRLVGGGAQLFVTFTERAREQLGLCGSLAGASRRLSPAELDRIFRHVHTLKSEARAFDLVDLERGLLRAEDALSILRKGRPDDAEGSPEAEDVRGALSAALRSADDAIVGIREDFVAASPVGRAVLDQITVQRSELEELTALVGARDDAMARAVERLASRRFGESVAMLVDVAPSWAERLDKALNLEIDGRDVRVPSALARVLSGVLTHLVRNAIAHGIETAREREEAGKEPRGTVRISARAGATGPTMRVEDDGRGLDLAKLAARARALGIDVPDDPADLVFRAGITTREEADDLAGRGVGLDAVRTELATVGYTVRVETVAKKGTAYTLAPRRP